MSRIFVSHSSKNNAAAIAIRDWLVAEGWDDLFLDLDPERGIVAGERWERVLNEAASRCEVVVFLVSRIWLASPWCAKEFRLADKLNKRMFGVLIEDIPIADLPAEMTRDWQLINLAGGRDHQTFRAVTPDGAIEEHITFSMSGLARLKAGLARAGLDPRYFAWPPETDPDRAPYRGLRALEAEDAGIFFGREAPTVAALDRLRGLAETGKPQLMVVLGASGSGKSSFLRAGLLPRIARDDRKFVALPVVRPERAALTSDTGLIRSLDQAFTKAGLGIKRADLKMMIEAGAADLAPSLTALSESARVPDLPGEPPTSAPTLVLALDQGEELFLAEGAREAQAFLALAGDLLRLTDLSLIVIVTIRSDAYDRLQSAAALEGIRQETLSLPPLPKGAYQTVIEGPAERLRQSRRPLKIEPALTQSLLADIEAGGTKDALPLLAFTLERLYVDYGGDGDLTLADYTDIGGVKGSIEAAVERALQMADSDARIPKDRNARLALLRRGLIPWLAGVDPETNAPRRRVARLAEIPEEARPLVQHLIEARLLSTDVDAATGAVTLEPAHEALLRQWGLLQGWLNEDAGQLNVMEGVKGAARDWIANSRHASWLVHLSGRLEAANQLHSRPDLEAGLGPKDRDYLLACQKKEMAHRTRARLGQTLIYSMFMSIIVGLVGWINQSYLLVQWHWWVIELPYIRAVVRPYLLTAEAERRLKPGASFRECAKDCPEMVVVPAGTFLMGSSALGNRQAQSAVPMHEVTISKSFAVSKFDVTFAAWDACVSLGGCSPVSDNGWGRSAQPVINVGWDDAQQYVTWLSGITSRPYRLLSEAEWEYAARAGSTTNYFWGDKVGVGNANCTGCGSKWDGMQPSPVGSFNPNPFRLFDMAGNVWQWVQDCIHDDYTGAPLDGSAWIAGDCSRHVVRGGAWDSDPKSLYSAFRSRGASDARSRGFGFRIARDLNTAAQ